MSWTTLKDMRAPSVPPGTSAPTSGRPLVGRSCRSRTLALRSRTPGWRQGAFTVSSPGAGDQSSSGDLRDDQQDGRRRPGLRGRPGRTLQLVHVTACRGDGHQGTPPLNRTRPSSLALESGRQGGVADGPAGADPERRRQRPT
jgi:hypothetical protein